MINELNRTFTEVAVMHILAFILIIAIIVLVLIVICCSAK